MKVIWSFLAVSLVATFSSKVGACVCYPGQEQAPNSDGPQYRWSLAAKQPTECTEFRLGGLNARPHSKPHEVVIGANLMNLQRVKTGALNSTCTFTTNPPGTGNYLFILDPPCVPFRLDFSVKTLRDALIALAEEKHKASIFAEILIGGWGNTKSIVQPRRSNSWTELLAVHKENGLLHVNESRSFWLEYKEGIVAVGKGGEERPFLELDADAYHGRAPSQVHIGIASWWDVDGGAQWVFYQFCE